MRVSSRGLYSKKKMEDKIRAGLVSLTRIIGTGGRDHQETCTMLTKDKSETKDFQSNFEPTSHLTKLDKDECDSIESDAKGNPSHDLIRLQK